MLFEETQKIVPERSKRVLMIACIIIFASYIISMLILYYDGGFSAADTFRFFPIMIVVVFIILFTQKLTVSVTSESLTITGGKKRVIPISEIKSVRIERFGKITWKYGNGAKYNGKRSYIAGDAEEGVWIELKNGDPFLITSKRTNELERVLKDAIGSREEL